MLNFCIFLKTKLKIYLFKLPKRRDNFRRLPLLGAKKVKSGRFKLTHRRDFAPQKGDICAFIIKIKAPVSAL